MRKLAGSLLYLVIVSHVQAQQLVPSQAVDAIVKLEQATGGASSTVLHNFISQALSKTVHLDPSQAAWSRLALTESIKTTSDAQSMIRTLRDRINMESNDPELIAAADKILGQELKLTRMVKASPPRRRIPIPGSGKKIILTTRVTSPADLQVESASPKLGIAQSGELLIRISALRINGRDVELYEYLEHSGLLTSGISCTSFTNRNCRLSLLGHTQEKLHASHAHRVKIVLENPDDFIRTYDSQRFQREDKGNSSPPFENSKEEDKNVPKPSSDTEPATCEHQTCFSDRDTSFGWDCNHIEVEVSSNGEVSIGVNLVKIHL